MSSCLVPKGVLAAGLMAGCSLSLAQSLFIHGISSSGRPVKGEFQFQPVALVNVLTVEEEAGTWHQIVHGRSLVTLQSPDRTGLWGTAWYVNEEGGASFVENGAGPPNDAIDLVVDRYKEADGDSRLRLVFNSYTGYGHYGFHSTLTLNYGCQCGDLYDGVLNARLLAGRPVLSAVAFNEESYADVWGDGSWHKERQLAFAVSEPSTAWLSVAGFAMVAWVYRRQRAKKAR